MDHTTTTRHDTTTRTDDRPADDLPVLEFPHHGSDHVEHPFDAAERVLALAS